MATTDLGTDLALTLVNGVLDLDPMGRTVTGRAALAQTIACRLATPTGRLALIGDDPDAGYDVRELVNDTLDPRSLAALRARVAAECLRDERVQAATVTTVVPRAEGLALAVRLVDAAGPFTLTLAVTDVTVTVLQVGR